MQVNRRSFLKKSALATALTIPGAQACKLVSEPGKEFPSLKQLSKPVAISMWDFSWLLRHHRLGEFESFDRVLDELSERGYNSIRLDAFPHFIAADKHGQVQERFYHPKDNWKPALWGNNFSMHSNPRKSLVEILQKCYARKISVGLSTWFLGHGTDRNLEFTGLEGFVRAWSETLSFLEEQDLLHGVLYVDLLNEYPLWHGFDWLKSELQTISDLNTYQLNNPDAHIAAADFLKPGERTYNPLQQKFYKQFIVDAIRILKEKWTSLDFFASQTFSLNEPWEEADFTGFDGFDAHIWFTHYYKFGDKSGYYDKVHGCKNDLGFEKANSGISTYWKKTGPC
jgi:Sugar-binding cellulase-like